MTKLPKKNYNKVDFFLEKNTDRLWLNEINTIPGFTERSLLPKAAQATGMTFSQLCSRIAELALCRNKAV